MYFKAHKSKGRILRVELAKIKNSARPQPKILRLAINPRSKDGNDQSKAVFPEAKIRRGRSLVKTKALPRL